MTTPVVINVAVAIIERPDIREMPHTPWPLVQPLPSTAPNPTRMPARPSNAMLLEIVTTGACPIKPNHNGAVSKRPAIKVRPCGSPFVSIAGGRILETIPLIPATRPWLAIRMTADIPISPPPKSDANGVNSVSNVKLLIVFTKTVTY